MAVLFISEQYVKNTTLIDENVDMRLILPSISDVQELRIHPILGTPMYEDIKAKITAGTLTADEINLLDNYVAPAMAKWVMYECSASMLFKYRNKSVATKSSENSQPVSYQDLQFLRDEWKNKAEEREARLINFLCDNDNLFTKYKEHSDDLNPRKTAYQTSYFLGAGSSNFCWKDDYNYYKK